MPATFSLPNYLRRAHRNYKGTRVHERYLVLESDDWGMIRMASPQAYRALLQKGYPVDQNNYSRFDALESNTDLEGLMEVLHSVRDQKGHPAVMTMNNVVGNPDFLKIKQSDFQGYHYEPFTETLRKYPQHNRVMQLYNEGIGAGVFNPQFHGREHVHVNNWMKALRDCVPAVREVLDYGMFTVNGKSRNGCKSVFLDAMACYNPEDFRFVSGAVADGLNLFENIWGFRSATVIAPCYIWNTALHPVFAANGIRLVQSAVVQKEPTGQAYRNGRVYMGKLAGNGLRYTVRNATFEPASGGTADWVDACMADIKAAFQWRRPAIISTHRFNYIGWLHAENRSRNLRLLQTLLQRVVAAYPDVQFVSSDQLTAVLNRKD